MAAAPSPIIVVVFEDPRQADSAIAELRQCGFGDDQIGVAMRDGDRPSGTAAGSPVAGTGRPAGTTAGSPVTGSSKPSGTTDADADESPVAKGALTGALAGLGLGALVGLGVLAGVIPGVGPAIAGGTLGILLSNAAAGAAVAGLTGALIAAGLSEEDAKYYQDEFEKGRTVVTVDGGSRRDEAESILRRHGGYDRTTGAATAGSTAATGATTRSGGKA
jgi:hypothetical protein